MLVLLTVLPTKAQQSSSAPALHGTVTDAATGEVLPDVNVSIPALERGAVTGPKGRYRITGLPARTLTVRFGFVGYKTQVQQVTLEQGETRTLDVALSESTLQGEEITVTGTPTAQSTLRSTQDVSVVPPEDLETERTAALGDLLEQTVPGAASVKTGPQAGKPVLRGLSGNRVKLLKNSVAQEYYQFGVRHFPNTSLAEAQRLEVVRGPASLLYGSDALGGAINVITRPAPREGLGGRIGGQYFANNNERAVTGELHGGAALDQGTTLGARFGGERRVAGNFNTPETATFFETHQGGTFGDPKYVGEVPFTNFEQWSAFGQVGAEGSFGSVQLYGDLWQNRHNFVLPQGGPAGSASNPPLGLGQNLEQYNVQLRGTLPTGRWVLRPRLSAQRAIRQSAGAGNTLRVVEEAEEESSFDYPVDLRKDVYTGRFEAEHPAAGDLSGTVGVEATLQDGTSRGRVPLEPTSTVYNVGVFAFEELDLEPWTVSGGLRLDYRTLSADPPQATREALSISPEDQLEKDYATLSGSIGTSYVFSDGFSLYSNLGTGFRAPSVFELYANGQHGGVAAFQQGNPSLKPERTVSFDLGLRVRTGRLTGEIVSYYTYFTNYIFLRNTGDHLNSDGSGPPIYTSGQTEAHLGGAEAHAHVALLPWLAVGAEGAVLFSRGSDLEPNAEGDRILPLLPAHRVGSFLRLEPSGVGVFRNPRIEIDVRHALAKDSAGRFEPFSQFDAGFGPPFGTASTHAYTLVDLSAGTLLQVGSVPVTLSVGVKNFTNEAYRNFLDTYKGYTLSPGRNMFVKLSVPFEVGM